MIKELQQYFADKKLLKLTQRQTKHSASKKGHTHIHGLSRGQRKDAEKALKSLVENIKLD